MKAEKYDKVKKILKIESDAILNLPINETLFDVVDAISKCKGKLITSGIGKSGNIAQKVSSSFSSTGTPSFFLHPSDAQHGDLGMIDNNDILLVFSNSGKTKEILELILSIDNLHKKEVTIISITSDFQSEIGKLSDFSLSIGKTIEICPLNLAPTTSSIAMLSLCDLLVVLTMENKNFTKEDFIKRHKGGYLGKI